MDALVFGEFCEHLTNQLQKMEDTAGKDDTLSMSSLLKPRSETPQERPEDEQDFLKAHDGNYLKAKEAGEL